MVSALAEEMKDDHYQRDDQNDVDQPADHFLHEHEAKQPDDDQNYSYGEKHGTYLRQEASTKNDAMLIAKIVLAAFR